MYWSTLKVFQTLTSKLFSFTAGSDKIGKLFLNYSR